MHALRQSPLLPAIVLAAAACCLAASQTGAADVAKDAPTAPVAAVDAPSGRVLDPSALDASWEKIIASLARPQTVRADFTERRWFAVRKLPVVLQGELRRSPERGLSLRYVEPEEQLMVIDRAGVLLRNAAGRTRTLMSDPRAPQIDALLLPILRFDLAALHERFEIRGSLDGTRWRLDLVPRAAELARSAGRVAISGDGELVRRIEFSRGPKQRVEVELGETRLGAEFSDEELRRYFR